MSIIVKCHVSDGNRPIAGQETLKIIDWLIV